MAKISKFEAKRVAKKVAGKTKVIGYLRVSTLGQEIEKNKSNILALAN